MSKRFGGRLAVFVTAEGVEKAVPAGLSNRLDECDDAMELYRLVREEISGFDAAIRRKVATRDEARKPPVTIGT